MAVPALAIVLSSYNGVKFIEEQVLSILRQSYNNWYLLIRDDGSRDGTVRTLDRLRKSFPDKVFIHQDSHGNVGPVRSFSLLLEATDAPYVMFCDQDDVWLPGKVKLTLDCMLMLEATHGSAIPLLVHTDLHVVDEKCDLVADSFWKYGHLNPQEGTSLNRLLMKNCVTGNTVMINRALCGYAIPVPENIAMYDWWFALVATLLGRVGSLKEQTVQYRQHGKNIVGADRWPEQFLNVAFAVRKMVRARLVARSRQAALLLEHFSDIITPADREVLTCVSGLASCRFISVRYYMWKYRLFTCDRFKNLLYFLFA